MVRKNILPLNLLHIHGGRFGGGKKLSNILNKCRWPFVKKEHKVHTETYYGKKVWGEKKTKGGGGTGTGKESPKMGGGGGGLPIDIKGARMKGYQKGSRWGGWLFQEGEK